MGNCCKKLSKSFDSINYSSGREESALLHKKKHKTYKYKISVH
jgi:hypothetical protein